MKLNLKRREKKNKKNDNKLVARFKQLPDKTKKVLIAIFGVLILAIIIFVVITVNNNIKKNYVRNNTNIDFNDPTYEGKEIIVDTDKVTIIEENGSKTIETVGGKDSDYIKADDEASKFSLENFDLVTTKIKTILNGTVTNNDSKYTKVIINVKYYQDEKIVGSTSTMIDNLKKGTKKSFTTSILGDFVNATYKVTIEYVG